MTRVAQSVEVKCTPDSLMEYIVDVTNHPAFIGPLKSVTNVKGDVRKPGTSWDWVYNISGVELTGKAETVRLVPAKEFIYKTTTGAKSPITYKADAAGPRNKLSLNVEYEVPTNENGKMKASMFENLNEQEGKHVV